LAGTPIERGAVLGRIEVPVEIAEIRAREPETARAIQAGVADAFDRYFDEGLAVTGFEKTGGTGTYLFGIWEKP
jgi:predicted GNAT superfamily acetyltransferase